MTSDAAWLFLRTTILARARHVLIGELRLSQHLFRRAAPDEASPIKIVE